MSGIEYSGPIIPTKPSVVRSVVISVFYTILPLAVILGILFMNRPAARMSDTPAQAQGVPLAGVAVIDGQQMALAAAYVDATKPLVGAATNPKDQPPVATCTGLFGPWDQGMACLNKLPDLATVKADYNRYETELFLTDEAGTAWDRMTKLAADKVDGRAIIAINSSISEADARRQMESVVGAADAAKLPFVRVTDVTLKNTTKVQKGLKPFADQRSQLRVIQTIGTTPMEVRALALTGRGILDTCYNAARGFFGRERVVTYERTLYDTKVVTKVVNNTEVKIITNDVTKYVTTTATATVTNDVTHNVTSTVTSTAPGSTETATVTVTTTVPGKTATYTPPAETITLPAQTVTMPGSTTTIIVPPQTITKTINSTTTIAVPGSTTTVTASPVTLPAQTVTLPGKTITLPAQTITETVTATKTVPGPVKTMYVTVTWTVPPKASPTYTPPIG